MTDIDKLRALFNGFGVKYEVECREPETIPSYPLFGKGRLTWVITDEGIGYTGFAAIYYFDAAGKFVNYAVCE